jgi:beta-glucosidase
MKFSLFMSTFLLITGVTLQAQDHYIKANEIVSKMTTAEKVNLVVGMGMKLGTLNMPGGASLVGQTMDKVPGAAGTTFAVPQLGVPTTVVADGPAGLRIEPKREKDANTYFATAWPVATLLASTWDTKLVEQVGVAMGKEVKEYGVDVILAPGMNIMRNPLGGRNFEYYSEDPFVTGKLATAMVKGIQSNGVGTSIKHYAVNNQESNRTSVNTIVSERALREIYLRGFEIAVKESQPWTVMSSYNLLNGTYTSQSYDLLTTILRKEWGFKGIVMTDWFGGKDAILQMKAGNDLLMPGTPEQRKSITEAVNNKTLDIKILDENAVRVVAYILGTPAFQKYAFSNKPDLKKHALIAREAAANGMVLLKNTNTALPLTGIKSIAAFGNTSYDFISGGTGSGDVNEEYTVSLVEGLTNAGFTIESELKSIYTAYLFDYKSRNPKKSFIEEFMKPTPFATEMILDHQTINSKAATSDIAVITIGRNAGEGKDRVVANDFNLKESEVKLINAVSTAFHAKGKKVVVIINAGGVIEVASWRDKVDAILLAWQPGLEAGNAVADVLSGKVNPSGKLTVTFPIKYEDEVTAKNFPGKEFPEKAKPGMMGMKEIPAEVVHEEGIYVGYRYYNTFNVKPIYEFGYGLSYTNFTYSNLKLSSSTFKGKLIVSIEVTNTGNVAGREAVQLYLSAPSAKLDKPNEELKAFGKTDLLQPGQKQIITFVLEPKQLASFNTASTAWVAEAGTYTVKVGASSVDIKQKATFVLSRELTVEKCNKVLVPQVQINELKK